MMDNHCMMIQLKHAAEEWDKAHPTIPTFAINYGIACRDAANRIEELDTQIAALRERNVELEKKLSTKDWNEGTET